MVIYVSEGRPYGISLLISKKRRIQLRNTFTRVQKMHVCVKVRYLLVLLMSSLALASTYPTTNGRTVIVGGGIHAVTIAYFLTKRGHAPLLIEREKIAAAASGKSGGFLARGWGSGPTVELHEKSFDLHEAMAKELGIHSFRLIPTLSVNGRHKATSNPASWLDGKATASLMDGASAQVTPSEYCEKVWQAAEKAGAELRIGTATSLSWNANQCTGVVLEDGEEILVGKLIVAAGPWTGHLVENWFGLDMPMTGIKSTSIVYENNQAVQNEPFAAFCDEDSNGCHLELYPRADGSIYICGCGGSDYVDNSRMQPGGDCSTPSLIQPDPKRVEAASASFKGLTSLGNKPPDVTQACMRPCLQDALPAMGSVPSTDNCFISAGHNCWGILWAPISGLCMSELVLEGKSSSVDLRSFDPGRFTKDLSCVGGRGRRRGTKMVGEQW